MTTTATPPDYAEGYGELVRAHRMYMGISQRTLAERIGMGERSLSDIEVGRRACPPGFVDTVRQIAGDFDKQVDDLVLNAEVLNDGDALGPVEVDPRDDWKRAVVGRAAVENAAIMPTLVGKVPTGEGAPAR